MKELRDILESQWMYHGSTKSDLKTLKADRDDSVPDRAIGAHFAADRSVSAKFANGLYKKDGTKGTVYRTKTPPRSQLQTVHQKIYKHGAVASDQAAIGAHIAGTVFSKPEHKELFKAWAKHARGIDDETAEKLHTHLSAGKAPANQNVFGTASAKHSNSFKSYFANYDSTLNMEPHEGFRKQVIGHYLDHMRAKGIKGLVYKNTSPMETGHLPRDTDRRHPRNIGERGSTKSYIIFDPEHHKLEPHNEEFRINEGRVGDLYKAWKLHTRDELRRGNKAMHPVVQGMGAAYLGGHLGAAAAHAASGNLGTAALHVGLGLTTVSPFLVNHPREIKRIYKHLRSQPERDQKWKEHGEQKARQKEFDDVRQAKQATRDKINTKRRARYAARNESDCISFKDYLSEYEKPRRTVTTARKLLHRIKGMDRFKGSFDNTINPLIPREDFEPHKFKGETVKPEHWEKHGKLKHVPVGEVSTRQLSVHVPTLDSKLKGSYRNPIPTHPYVVKTPDGKHRLYDGNHRFARAKLLRKPTVLSRVLEVD